MEFQIPFSGRSHHYNDEEIHSVMKAMCSAVPLTQGRNLTDFENRFKKYTGANYAFAVTNATSAP